jgi:hypothetical protein
VKFSVKIYLIILFSVGVLILINETNLFFLKPNFPFKQGLITTADEYSYFSPVDQFVETGIWAENSLGAKAYMRTPGYGLIYLIAKVIGGSTAFLFLKTIQILLFAGSVYLFSKILITLKLSEKLTLVGTLIFGLMPMFSGFVYYTLSESVLPFFVLWSFYALLKANENQRNSLNVMIALGFLLLLRPQMLVLTSLFLFYFLLMRKRIFWSVLLAFVPLFFWNIRTVYITGEWLGLNPIYSKNNNSLYREPHKEMTDLFRVWEYRGDYFHSTMAILSRDTSNTTTQSVLKTIPIQYQATVRPIFLEFQKFRHQQITAYANKKISSYLPVEKALIGNIKLARKKLIRDNPADFYLITPLKSFKKLMLTSMMNLFVFQETWKEQPIVLILKYVSFLLISLGFFSSILLLIKSSNPFIRVSALSVLASIFYLSFGQRFNEERYLLPFLSLLLIHLLVYLEQIFQFKIKKKPLIEQLSFIT